MNMKYISMMALAGLACAACSREGELRYQDPYANPDAKVGRQEREYAEPADRHEGRYSVHGYEFEGRGEPHLMSDVEALDLNHSGSRGSSIDAKVHIEWPEDGAGLTKDALAKVRRAILWMAFVSEAPTAWKDDDTPIVYIVPEALGETEGSLKNRIKFLRLKEGHRWEDDKYGLSPADWCILASDALSIRTGRLPLKDNGRVTGKSLELAIAGIKRCAQDKYECGQPEAGHYCSQWTFEANQHLDWPFGMTAKEGAEWYERPVLCVWNEGYSNDGGNGCHSDYTAKIYSVPDGYELGVEDYFAPDKLGALAQLVTERLYQGCLEAEEAAEKSPYPLDLDGAYMLVTREGIKWTWGPYSILPGCYGTPSVTIPWSDLALFRK